VSSNDGTSREMSFVRLRFAPLVSLFLDRGEPNRNATAG